MLLDLCVGPSILHITIVYALILGENIFDVLTVRLDLDKSQI